jgi:hypothetical protein
VQEKGRLSSWWTASDTGWGLESNRELSADGRVDATGKQWRRLLANVT